MKKIMYISLLLAMCISIASAQPRGLNIGNIAPDIRLPNLKGDTVSLYSFRNKIVLIDFWASWCAPCVNEQPKLAVLYKKYKNSAFKGAQGFEIYAVSLDNKKKSWQSIVKKYDIKWTQVSDLKFWASPVAAAYNLQELPFNLLIDGKGVIIAKNLHEAELEKAIRKMMVQPDK
jgi:peroxiredoxin